MALEWLKQRSSELIANMKTEVAKFKNKTFLEATVPVA
jgi:tellurite resistance protein